MKTESILEEFAQIELPKDGPPGIVILNKVGKKFVELRERGGQSQAFAALQAGVMGNLGTVLSAQASLKDCIGIALDIEKFRRSEAAVGKTASEVFSEWLRAEDA